MIDPIITHPIRCLTGLIIALLFATVTTVRLCGETNPRQNVEPDGRSRTFSLYLVNETDQPVTFTIHEYGWACCDSPLRDDVYGPVPPGGRITVWIARVQGNGCDGNQGQFWLVASGYGGQDRQEFSFNNDGGIYLVNTPNRFSGKLSKKNSADGSYMWTMSSLKDSPRLLSPVDERLTQPRTYIAADTGHWSRNTAKEQSLLYDFLPGIWATHFEDCNLVIDKPVLFHPQHVIRLPNKDGVAYFVIAGSRGYNGYITFLRSKPGVLDPETDLLRPNGNSPILTAFKQWVYTGEFNGTFSGIGEWNHPGKMSLAGGVLVVAAQNWSETKLMGICTHQLSNHYLRGGSEDSLLFYDVRDPATPTYWGRMTAQELGLPYVYQQNGPDKVFKAFVQISSLSLVRAPAENGEEVWVLTAGEGADGHFTSIKFGALGIDGVKLTEAEKFKSWKTTKLSPNIEDWHPLTNHVRLDTQHGTSFNNYQLENSPPADLLAAHPNLANGLERITVFGASDYNVNDFNGIPYLVGLRWSFTHHPYEAKGDTFPGYWNSNSGDELPPPPDPVVFPGDEAKALNRTLIVDRGDAGKNYDAESMYITRKGMPIAYTVASGYDAYSLLQTHDTVNLADPIFQQQPVANKRVENTNDSGTGSLRHAIGYGGKITFAPGLSGQTIRLTGGPLIAYLYDVDIDASALPGGITLSGNGFSSVLHVERGVEATLRGVTVRDGSSVRDPNVSQALVNRGTLELYDSTLSDNLVALWSFSGDVLLQNCTVTTNFHTAIWNAAGSSMVLRHCTVAGNIMSGGATAVVNLGAMTIENSIVANNVNAVGTADVFGAYTTVGANWIGGDARLAPRARNGGRTDTLAPLPDSPAIDAASVSSVNSDQADSPRPIGSAADLGAIEAVIVRATSSSSLSHFSLQGETLSWSPLPGATFGVFLDSGTGFASLGTTSGTTFALPDLSGNKNYQWRIDITYRGRTHAGIAQAFTTRGSLVVTTLADENDARLREGAGDSLRELLNEASPGELITFGAGLSGGTIRLRGAAFRLDQDVTIDASRLADRLTIDAGGNSRIFQVSAGKTVTLRGLSIAHGAAESGAGILNDGGTLSLQRCTLSRNEATGQGGGVFNANGGSLKVSDGTVFERNFARDGGGIFNATGCLLEVNGATFSRNEALSAGGGINNRGAAFTVKAASFSGNGAATGGAIDDQTGTGLVENCTLARNSSASGVGGGIANHGTGVLTVRHCTIAENVGAGVFNDGSNPVTLDNSIVSGNFDLKNGASDLQGRYTAVGANLVRVTTGSVLAGGPAPLTSDPLLGSLSSGTLPLRVGSPAIDGGVATANTPSTDQERQFRPNGPAPDLGALESRLSADVDLLWLTTSGGAYGPVFERSTTNYTVNVPAATTTAAVRAAKGQGGQSLDVRINGGAFSTIGDKQASSYLPLVPGENQLEVKVTSASGTVNRTYTITIFRGATSDANSGLASLTTSSGALSPAFDFATPSYHAAVPNGVAATTVTAVAAKGGSRIEMRANFGPFVALQSGVASLALPLNVGANTIDFRVFGSDDAPAASYALTVTRAAPTQSDGNLAVLTTGAGTLNPSFAPGVSFYRATVGGGVTSATLTPTAAQAGAAIQVRANGGAFTTVTSGATSTALGLHPGRNILEAKVTAPDGATIRSYSVIVSRLDESIEWASSPGNASSSTPKISADGRFVAFSSRAGNLVPDDTNSTDDVFVHDRVTMTTERVSVSDAGVQGNFPSLNPSISADGRFVAFDSEATNLVPDDSNGQSSRSAGVDVFVYDRTTHTIERVSLTESGVQVNQASRNASISGDGRYVAFYSSGNNLISGFRNGEVNVYVRDRVESTIVGVSVPFSVNPSNRASLNPVISEDGDYVAFEFTASLNDGNRSFSYRDVYLFNRVTRAVERLTGTKVGIEADRTDSRLPAISADGRYVAFQTTSEDLDFFDVNGRADVFVYDRITGTTRRVSASPTGVDELFQDSINASISGDGRFVAFQSRIANFVTPDTNDNIDVFVKDLVTGRLSLKSSSPAGVQGDGDSTFPSLSADGQSVAFVSRATNLDTADTNNIGDVFVVTAAAPMSGSVADLALLVTSLGALAPGFSPDVAAYAQNAADEVESAWVRALAADPGATIAMRINASAFTALESGAVSQAVPLVAGNNTIELRTTAADGAAGRTYSLTIVRALSSDATLAELDVGSAEVLALTPEFASGTRTYAATAPSDAAFVTVSPFAAHPQATITVNGAGVPAGASSAPIALNLGANTVTTVVTAEDAATTATYVVVVTRAPSSDADLARLVPGVEPTSGFFAFNPIQTEYTMTVPSVTTALALTPTAADAAARIAVNGQPVASGATSGTIALTIGANALTVTVTAQDAATSKSYVLNVIRANPATVLSSNADLASLVASAGILSPAFAPTITAYVLSVPEATAALRLTPTSADARSIVSVNGLTVSFGGSSAELPLNAGATTVKVTVVAENGATEKVYEVTVTRSESPATISISQSNGIVILVFTGTIESAPAVDGPFAPVAGATSPHATVTDLDAEFDRAR